jgi:hypothetical protein
MDYTDKEFENTGVDVVGIRVREEENFLMIENLIAQLMLK